MAADVSAALAGWHTTGRQTLLQRLVDLSTSPSDVVGTYTLLAALLPAASTTVPPAELAALLDDALAAAASSPPSSSSSAPPAELASSDLPSLLANALYTHDTTLDERLSSSLAALKPAREADRTRWTAFLRALVGAPTAGPALARLADRFEFAFLERAGLTRSQADVLTKRNTRASTVKFYSLKKYNLLRESSEGFALVLVLLHSEENLGPGKDPATGWDVEDAETTARRARRLWAKVQSAVGFFELDPNRTLDVVLDAFLPHLRTHHRLFLALLRCSPWAPPSPPPADAADIGLDLHGERGLTAVGQVLGFKFRFYASQDSLRDGRPTPPELYLLAAVLVREGFVRLQDLWSHLGPDEADVDRAEGNWRKAVNEKARSSKGNALLAAAAPLADDDAPASGGALADGSSGSGVGGADASKPLPVLPPPEQKLPLTHALLVVGAHAHAAHVLTRLPHLVNAEVDIADLVLRQLAFVLGPLLEAGRIPLGGCSVPGPGQPSKTPVLSLIAPTPVATRDKRFVNFMPEWSGGLRTVRTVDELFDGEAGPNGALGLLRLLGAQLGRRKDLLVRLVRIGRAAVSEDPDCKPQWDQLLRLSFLPALSLSGGCCSTSQEVWALLSLFSLETRYGIYGFWRAQYAASLQLKVQGAAAERDAKAVLRRVSKDDLKVHARALGKLSHSDPLVLWAVVLRQIQSYENLVKPVVESARYITPLGADTIVFMLLDAFSNPDKDRTKTDGTSTSLWLRALAAFAGELCRRHAQLIDSRPIVRYVANQLAAGNPKDLVILRELVSAMTAIDPLANLSDAQVAAMGGGAVLRAEAVHPTVPTVKMPVQPGTVVGPEPIVEKRGVTGRSAAKLAQALRDDGLAVPLLVAVAQARESCVFAVPEEEAHMKHLSSLFDNSTEVLFQLVDFLLQHVPADEYAAGLPSYVELAETYGLSPGVAFHLLRPKLTAELRLADAEKARETSRAKEARLKHEMMERKKNLAASAEQAAQETAAAATADGSTPAPSSPVPVSPAPSKSSPEPKYHPTLKALILSAQKTLPAPCRMTIGSPFFVSFWQLSPYDLEVPIASYQREIDRLERANSELGRFPLAAQTDQWRRERELLQGKSRELAREREAQMEAYVTCKRRLNIESAVWFRKATDSNLLLAQIFQHCVFPRALLSLADASYVARFLRMMHALGTTNFATLWFYNGFIFSEWLAPLVASFTENEARNYARFIHDCLEGLSAWRKSESLYLKEAHGDDKLLPGFRSKRVPDLRKQTPLAVDDMLPWDGFRKVMHKWSSRFVTALELCLASGEFMHIKNVVILLQKILPFFPREAGQGTQVETLVKNAIAHEKREDLKLLLQSYASQLGKLKPQWIPQAEIMDMRFKVSATSPKPSTNDSTASSPKPESTSDAAPASSKAEAMDVDDAPAASVPAAATNTNGSAAPSRLPTPAATTSGAESATKPQAVNAEAESLRARLQASSSTDKAGSPSAAAPAGPPPSGPRSQNLDAPSGPRSDANGGRAPVDAPKGPGGARTNGSSTPAAAASARPASPVKDSQSDIPPRPPMTSAASSSFNTNGDRSGLPSRPAPRGGNANQPLASPPAPSRQSSTTHIDRRPASPPPQLLSGRSSRRSPSPVDRRRRAGSVESTRSRQSASTKGRDGRASETEKERAERRTRERNDDDRHRHGDDRDDRSRSSRDRRGKDRDGRDRDRERDSRGKERDGRDDRNGRRPSPSRDSRGPRDDRDRDRDRDPRDSKRARRDEDPRSGLPSGANSSTRRSLSPTVPTGRGGPRERDSAPHMAPPRNPPPARAGLPPAPHQARRDRSPPGGRGIRERATTPPGARQQLPDRPDAAPSSRGGPLASRMGIAPVAAPSSLPPPPPRAAAAAVEPPPAPKPRTSVPPTAEPAAESKKRSASQRDDMPPDARSRTRINRASKYSAIDQHLGNSSSSRR